MSEKLNNTQHNWRHLVPLIYSGDKEPSGHHDVEQVEHRNPFRLSARMPRNSNKPWIPEDDKRLLELKAAGKSNGAIGVTLARSTGSIIGRLSVLNTRTARLKRAATSNAQSVP
jgi:hypothetical protein